MEIFSGRRKGGCDEHPVKYKYLRLYESTG